MGGNLGRVEVNEAADLVVRDAAELPPVAEGANRGLFAGREMPQVRRPTMSMSCELM